MTINLSDMKTLKTFFEETFRLPLSTIMTRQDVIPLDNNAVDKAFLFGSVSAKNNIYISQADMDDFIVSPPPFFFQTGYAGHGLNSWGILYIRSDENSNVFLRLPYGGLSGNEEMAQRVHRFLVNYYIFEARIKEVAKFFVAADSMYEGHYKIELHSGEHFEMHESLFRNPFFDECFGHLYAKGTD